MPNTNPVGPPTVFCDRFTDYKNYHYYPDPVGVLPETVAVWQGPTPPPAVGELVGSPDQWINGLSYSVYSSGGYRNPNGCAPLGPFARMKLKQEQDVQVSPYAPFRVQQAQTVSVAGARVGIDQAQTVSAPSILPRIDQVQTFFGPPLPLAIDQAQSLTTPSPASFAWTGQAQNVQVTPAIGPIPTGCSGVAVPQHLELDTNSGFPGNCLGGQLTPSFYDITLGYWTTGDQPGSVNGWNFSWRCNGTQWQYSFVEAGNPPSWTNATGVSNPPFFWNQSTTFPFDVCPGSAGSVLQLIVRAGEGDMAITGEVISFAGTTTPSGYLPCDGSAVSRSTYALLFSVIGTTWGPGDGSTTFNVPDLRDRAVIGTSPGSLGSDRPTARTIGQVGGEEAHVLDVAELPEFSLEVESNATTVDVGTHQIVSGLTDFGDGSQDNTTSAVGSNTAHNTMQPFGVVAWFIKT